MSTPKNTGDPEFFARQLIKLRGRKTQSEFAEELGIKHQQTYQRYEGGRIPRRHILEEIAAKLGVTAEYLVVPPDSGYSPGMIEKDPFAYASDNLHKLGREIPTREDCIDYMNTFLDRAVKDDPVKLSWTWVELHAKFPVEKWR